MGEDYGKTYGIEKLAELLIERGIEFSVMDETSLVYMDGVGNLHECWMAGTDENHVNALIVVTPEQLLSVPDINGIITENVKLRELVRIAVKYCDSGTCDGCPIQFESGGCPYSYMARDLGIEVSE